MIVFTQGIVAGKKLYSIIPTADDIVHYMKRFINLS